MTRSEKKQATETRRLELIGAWCLELKNSLHDGVVYKQATLNLADGVTKLIRQQPQRKVEILSAWARMWAEIRKHEALLDTSKVDEIEQVLQNDENIS